MRKQAASNQLRVLRFRLILLVLLSILPALGYIVFASVNQRSNSVNDAKSEAMSVVTEISAEQHQLALSTQQLLITLSEIPQVVGYTSSSCSTQLGEIASKLNAYANIAVADTTGIIRCSAIPYQGAISVADEEFFQNALTPNPVSAGQITVGRISQKEVIVYAEPIKSDLGVVTGVIYASINLSYLSKLPSSIRLPTNSIVIIGDSNGMILATYPMSTTINGNKVFQNQSIDNTVINSDSGTVNAKSLDGIKRLFGYKKFGGPAKSNSGVILVGFPLAPIVQSANRSLFFGILELAIVSLAAVLAAWIVGMRLFSRMQLEAIQDQLTGLYNRRHTLELAGREFKRLSRVDHQLAIAMLDLDFFKTINDTYGHAMGDEVLKRVAGLILEGCREVDIVGRYGGEEFIVVLPDADNLVAIEVSERIRNLISGITFTSRRGGEFSLTVSIGITEATEDSPSLEVLIRQADKALYEAKENGRNQIAIFS